MHHSYHMYPALLQSGCASSASCLQDAVKHPNSGGSVSGCQTNRACRHCRFLYRERNINSIVTFSCVAMFSHVYTVQKWRFSKRIFQCQPRMSLPRSAPFCTLSKLAALAATSVHHFGPNCQEIL